MAGDIGTGTFLDAVASGFSSVQKSIPPKYFYDEKGSQLFERICSTPEYYVTRTESAILKDFAAEIAELNTDKKTIIELGSGSSVKTRYILKAFLRSSGNITYMPVDVSGIMVESSKLLLNDFEGLVIKGISGEYLDALEIVDKTVTEPKLIIFLGSSIGNFDLPHAEEFLKKISSVMKPNDSLLIGFDLVKDIKILNAAYNDKEGVTAEFNLNLLRRINNKLNADIDIANFEHKAFFNPEESRIEMHLVSKCDQTFSLNGTDLICLKENETIHTENSYKFTDEMIKDLARSADLKINNVWKDSRNYFGLSLMRK